MTDAQYRQALALFRYGLIAEFIQLPAGSRGLYARLREKARADYTIPGSTRTRVAPETLRHWLKDYRRGGFDALLPKGRADRGRSRALPQAVADALVSLKDEQPAAVDPAVDPRRARSGRCARVPGAAALHRAPPLEPRRPHAQGERPRRAPRTGAASPSHTPGSSG